MKVILLVLTLLTATFYSDTSIAVSRDKLAVGLRGGGNGGGLRLLLGLLEIGEAVGNRRRERERKRQIRDDSRAHVDDGMIYDEKDGVCVHIDDIPYDERVSGE